MTGHLQHCISRLLVGDIIYANKLLLELKRLSLTLYFQPAEATILVYLTVSDARQKKSPHGQMEYISRIFFFSKTGSISHHTDWHSCQKTWLSFSSMGCEILAAATATDKGSLFPERLQLDSGASSSLPVIILVNFKDLYCTVTTMRKRADYRTRLAVFRIQD